MSLVHRPSGKFSASRKVELPHITEWRPNSGPQERYLASSALEVGYGGSAGAGKSEALLMGATRLIHLPHYRALLLRRTIPELKRSLIERSQEFYRGLGGEYNSSDKLWRFKSGAIIEFGSSDHPSDVTKYQSAEYQYIGFDELTSFEESQYLYLFSRLRTTHGIPLRIRFGTNPGGIGHDWVLRRFAPWLYPESEVSYQGLRVASGERLYYIVDRKTGQERWVPKGTPGAKSRAFFRALVKDNPYLAGTEYESNLDNLDPVTRAQLRDGDWMARPAKGAYFKRIWFEIVDVAPLIVVARVRYWDRAATPDGGDWTAGVLMSRTADGLWFVEDVIRGQWSPLEVEANIRLAAKLDPSNTRIVLEQDPAQAGKFEKEYYLRTLAGYDIHVVPPQGDTDNSKITRAKPVSAQAAAKNIRIVRGHWNEQYLRELEAFPEGHDDQVDATSGAFRQCLNTSTLLPVVGGTRVLMSGTPSLESSPYPLHSGTQRTRF